jgi:hypothetical protein
MTDYQHMCTGIEAVTSDFVDTYRKMGDKEHWKPPPMATARIMSMPIEGSASFRKRMANPSLTARERALANNVPGKTRLANGTAKYPWDANSDRDNIALCKGYKWVRNVHGSEAIWSARKEAAAHMGVSSASLDSLPEYGSEVMDDGHGGFQLSTPQVPKTNAGRSNYAISARNNNFGSNKSTHLEYGQLKGAHNDPTRDTTRGEHFSGRRQYWPKNDQSVSARNLPIKVLHQRTANGGFFARQGAEC